MRTSSPALDVHINTGNTPAHRLEQNASGGWGVQTWDIAGNEANFFVRDVTSGSRLPFRIRPGAPTSSIDIAANGNVGIGTASPSSLLAMQGGASPTLTITSNVATGDAGTPAIVLATAVNATKRYTVQRNAVTGFLDFKGGEASFSGYTLSVNNGTEVMRINNAGSVGIGTTAPAARLHTIGTVRFAGVANCGSGIQSNANGDLSCLASSRQFKSVNGGLAPEVALANVMALRPQTGAYKETPDVPEHWLIAEEVAAIDPALVGLNEGQPYVVKTQNVVANLIAVVQQQQRQIEELRRLVAAK